MIAEARVVVVGGGIGGVSTLYHLSRLGWSDVALVEANELTSGSTWHAPASARSSSRASHPEHQPDAATPDIGRAVRSARAGDRTPGRLPPVRQRSHRNHTIERSIALAYLPVEHAAVGTELTIGILGERRPAVVCEQPLLDPAGERLFS